MTDLEGDPKMFAKQNFGEGEGPAGPVRKVFMRIICIYRDNQDYTRSVEEWLENFRRQTGREIETMNPDENTGFCEAYDVVEYPTIMALGNRGEVHASWRGKALPLINEVLYYMI